MASKDSLLSRHQDLDLRIRQESQRPNPDPTILHSLKREKLLIKDTLANH